MGMYLLHQLLMDQTDTQIAVLAGSIFSANQQVNVFLMAIPSDKPNRSNAEMLVA
jgi:hypothetical protein